MDNAIPEGPTLTNSKTTSEKNSNLVGLNYYNVLNYYVILVSALALMTTDPESPEFSLTVSHIQAPNEPLVHSVFMSKMFSW